MEKRVLGRSITTVNLTKNERLLSLGSGIVMFVYGLIRLPLTAVLLLISGAYFIFRGVKGFCFLYEALGIEPPGLGRPETEQTAPQFSQQPPPEVDMSDPVTEAAWESFPTSDPPAWTMGRRD